jgi:hypothetical protein
MRGIKLAVYECSKSQGLDKVAKDRATAGRILRLAWQAEFNGSTGGKNAT